MKMTSALFDRIVQSARRRQPEIQALGEDIWCHPETGFREFRTQKVVMEYLEKQGIQASPAAMTGVRAELDTGRPGPVVAVVGELDALLQPLHPDADPATGAAHSCGHHTHAAAMAGAAAILAEKEILSQLWGKLVFLAAPGEEGIELNYRRQLLAQGKIKGLGGKVSMIRDGLFDDVDIAFMNHIGTGDGYGTSDCNGAVHKYVTFIGKSAHAAYPYGGINPLNGMDLARHAIALLRESASAKDPTIRIHGIITGGGDVVNTLPDQVSMEYMLRAGDVESLQRISALFDQAVSHAAQAMGCGLELETVAGYLPLRNCDGLAESFRELSAKLAPERPYRYKASHDYGCTDMGDVSQIRCALHMGVPGAGGKAHQNTFHLTDYEMAYSGNAATLALLAAEMLTDHATRAQEVLAQYPPAMDRTAYEKIVDGLNGKISFAPADI